MKNLKLNQLEKSEMNDIRGGRERVCHTTMGSCGVSGEAAKAAFLENKAINGLISIEESVWLHKYQQADS